MYKLVGKYTLLSLLLYFLQSLAWADTDTQRIIPPAGSIGSNKPMVNYHPEYKKLLDEIKRLQKKQESANDTSAAFGRQQIDAAASRLNQYLLSGKPTVLPGTPQSNSSGSSSSSSSSKASKTSVTGSSQHGKGGPSRVKSGSECSILFTYYEMLDLGEGIKKVVNGGLSSGCGEYALNWNGQSFSAISAYKSPSVGGGWEQKKTTITGTLSNDDKSILTLTVKNLEDGEKADGDVYNFSENITLTNLPLYKIRKVGKFNLYSFQVEGASKVRPRVTDFSKVNGKRFVNVDLVWDAEYKDVLWGYQKDPRIKIDIYKPIN